MEENQSPPTEKIFYQDGNVSVTQSRFIVNGKTHAMRNISSVANRRIAKSIAGPIWLIILGLVLFFFQGNASIAGMILIGLAILLIAVKKDSFAVRISSNSGETNGLISKDQNYIQTIVNAINDAIVHRG